MTQEEIKKILPHRDKMLLVDEAELCQDSLDENGQPTRCRGSYTIRGDEWFLQGHFPGNPVVPGVIQCEILAQSCCMLIDCDKGTPYFAGMKNVKWRRPVKPGDTMVTECRILRNVGGFYMAKGTGRVGDEVCVEAEFSFAVVENK